MKDPTAEAFQPAVKGPKLPQEEQHLRCPRCESTNTKFCYYNNYNLSQPRHFCKDCRRYWTKGGALRNIPVGGGTRKNSKRTSSAPSSSTKRSVNTLPSRAAIVTPISAVQFPKMEDIPSAFDPDRQLLDFTGSFSSLLTSHGNFGGLLDTFHAGLGTLPGTMGNTSLDLHSPGDGGSAATAVEAHTAALGNNLLGLPAESSCWSGSSSWSDLSIYTPGSNFQ